MPDDKGEGGSGQSRAAKIEIQPERDDNHGDEDGREQKNREKLLAGEIGSRQRIGGADPEGVERE